VGTCPQAQRWSRSTASGFRRRCTTPSSQVRIIRRPHRGDGVPVGCTPGSLLMAGRRLFFRISGDPPDRSYPIPISWLSRQMFRIDDLVHEIRYALRRHRCWSRTTRKIAEDPHRTTCFEQGVRVAFTSLRGRHARRVRAAARAAAGRFEVFGLHQPSPGGTRPARGLAGVDPRRPTRRASSLVTS